MEHASILRFRDVTIAYGRLPALSGVTFDVACGSLTAVLGPNGAGKSTMLRACLGWLPLVQGQIRIGDAHPHHALPRLAYLPQRHAVDWDFPLTVRDVVAQGRYPALRFWQRFGAADRAAVEQALTELELQAVAERPISDLSGGQQRRAFLARAVAQGADIFLLDEPFAGLDLAATEDLARILRAWAAQGRTVLAAIHDLELARRLFTDGILLSTRLVAAGPLSEVLTPANIARTYHPGGAVHA